MPENIDDVIEDAPEEIEEVEETPAEQPQYITQAQFEQGMAGVVSQIMGAIQQAGPARKPKAQEDDDKAYEDVIAEKTASIVLKTIREDQQAATQAERDRDSLIRQMAGDAPIDAVREALGAYSPQELRYLSQNPAMLKMMQAGAKASAKPATPQQPEQRRKAAPRSEGTFTNDGGNDLDYEGNQEMEKAKRAYGPVFAKMGMSPDKLDKAMRAYMKAGEKN